MDRDGGAFLLKLSGICGVLAPVVAFTCIGLSILYSPWFSWTDSWLSDLGGFYGGEPIWAARGIASILFNVGLIAAGILGMIFVVGLMKSRLLDKTLGRLGAAFLFIGTCALVGIGVFPETTGAPHGFFSVVFFFMVPLSLLFIAPSLIMSPDDNLRDLGRMTVVLLFVALVSATLFLVPPPWGSNAIAEIIPIVSISVFTVVFGFKLMWQASRLENKETKEKEKGRKISF